MKRCIPIAVLVLTAGLLPAFARKEKSPKPPVGPVPIAMLGEGRRLDWLRFLGSEQELHEKRSFFNKVVDFVAGPPEWHRLVRPYDLAIDSQGRILITDPGARCLHIFDLEKRKYTAIEGGKKDTFHSPIGVTVDDQDNIYVTDSQLGKVFVFDPRGKSRGMIGDIKGEGFYKRPTGIAFDPANHELYITDTIRDRVYVTDMTGQVLRYFGTRGTAPGEFNFPTEVVVHGDDVWVVDAMNFRVQSFTRQGVPRSQFGGIGIGPGRLFRPKGLAVDPQGNVYVVDASLEAVQVFTRDGRLLYTFGQTGGGIGNFQLPAGVAVDRQNRIYIADSYNHRLQIFQLVTGGNPSGGRD